MFPDKGLAISPDDIDGIVARFAAADAVPVKVEHADSPLDPLGLVKSVWRDGGALMGRLAFPAGPVGVFAAARDRQTLGRPGAQSPDAGRSVAGAAPPRRLGGAAER